MRKIVLLATAAAVVAIPITVSAQGARSLRASDVAEAQRQHPEVVAQFGGQESGPRGAYVQQIGQRVAAYSGTLNPQQAYRFTALNSAVENAFAVPGGYVYVTRQLMSLMNNESELAFALGHEVGHIAANHAQSRQSTASRNSILGVLGAVLGSVVGNNVFGNLISQGAQQAAQMATLSFSRDQEYQADDLGIRYLAAAGYDTAGAASMLGALGRASALEARIQGRDNRSLPEWASTHPLSTNRMQRAAAAAQSSGRAGKGLRNEAAFLNAIDGMLVDDDPKQGVIDGRSFTHPDLRMQFTVPQGFLMQNSTDAVTIRGSSGQAQFSGGRFNGSLNDYVYRVFNGLTGGRQQLSIPQPRRTQINGMEALYTTARANTRSGVIDVSVVAYRWSPNVAYHFVMLTRGGSGIGPFATMVDSLRRISPSEAAAIRPRVVDVVTVAPGLIGSASTPSPSTRETRWHHWRAGWPIRISARIASCR